MSDRRDPEFEPAAADPARVAEAASAWRRRSRLIRLMRRGLPLVIAGVTLSVLGWVGVRSVITGLNQPRAAAGEVRMTNPRFFGQDERGRSILIGAQEAVRAAEGGPVRLIGPSLRIAASPTRASELRADQGVYDEAGRSVVLTGGVRLVDADSGFRLEAGRTVVDTRTGALSGGDGVSASGPLGEVTASSYGITDRGERVVFEGGVKTRIDRSGGR